MITTIRFALANVFGWLARMATAALVDVDHDGMAWRLTGCGAL